MATVHDLGTIHDLEPLLAADHPRPVLLFKHSTRCEVSSHAEQEWRAFTTSVADDAASLARVLVVEHRDVSNEVARRLGIEHQSPQAILVVKGKALWHDSHFRIDRKSLQRALTDTRSLA